MKEFTSISLAALKLQCKYLQFLYVAEGKGWGCQQPSPKPVDFKNCGNTQKSQQIAYIKTNPKSGKSTLAVKHLFI